MLTISLLDSLSWYSEFVSLSTYFMIFSTKNFLVKSTVYANVVKRFMKKITEKAAPVLTKEAEKIAVNTTHPTTSKPTTNSNSTPTVTPAITQTSNKTPTPIDKKETNSGRQCGSKPNQGSSYQF